MSKTPRITCPTCHGTGQSELSPVLAETFLVVKRLKKASAVQVKKYIPDEVTGSAINNRLDDMLAMGLLGRKKVGKTYYYFVCQRSRQKA